MEWKARYSSVQPAASVQISAKRKFWARPVRAPTQAHVSDGLPPTPKLMLVTLWSSRLCPRIARPYVSSEPRNKSFQSLATYPRKVSAPATLRSHGGPAESDLQDANPRGL